MAGRHLRMQRVTIAPGGVFGPLHDHKDRPGLVYILHGTVGLPARHARLLDPPTAGLSRPRTGTAPEVTAEVGEAKRFSTG